MRDGFAAIAGLNSPGGIFFMGRLSGATSLAWN
jgi:hypothetical protein